MLFFRNNKIKLLFLLVFALSIASPIQTTHAQYFLAPLYTAEPTAVPTGDKASIMNTFINSFKEISLDGLVTSATKVVVSNITQSIVTWINSGFQGSPGFVSDPQKFLVDVADQTVGDFIQNETKWGFVCDPFKLDIRIALNLGYSSKYEQQNFCRLSKIVSNTEDFAKFTAGNFSKGGWNSWFEISQTPSNNPFGAYLAAKNELTLKTSQAVLSKEREANWGGGLLSWRDCLKKDPRTKKCLVQSEIKTPGSVINQQLNLALGTGQRQLELADEFNEIVGALIGQLARTVLTQGLSSFGSSGSNYRSLSDEANKDGTQVISCSPDRIYTTIGQTVSWTARVVADNVNNPEYAWYGHPEIEGETSKRVDVTYSTTGTKTASLDVTFYDEKGTRRVISEDCVSSVTVRQTSILDEIDPDDL